MASCLPIWTRCSLTETRRVTACEPWTCERDIRYCPREHLVGRPGEKLSSKALEHFVRDGATTYFHQSGTCRMSRDDKAVVDAKLRVNRVRNLRIADSSIMPRIPAVATMASCTLIGERMAETLTRGSL